MNLVFAGGLQPIEGEGSLWRGVEGEIAHCILREVPNDATLADADYPGATQLWIGRQLWPQAETQAPSAAALLTVAQEPVDGHEEDFHNWMEQEHVPGLAAVPGVLAARRYVAIKGSPRYLAIYYLSGTGVLASEAWKVAGTSSWSERLLPYRRGRVRCVFERA